MTVQTPHILVVDDDAEIRKPLSRYLSQHGFRVSTARDGQSLDQVLDSSAIDLIVLDIMMPGEDGLSICRRVRNNQAIPVILLTAMGDEVDRIVGLEVGADDYVPKPFNPRELTARIKAVLRRSEMMPRKTLQSKGKVIFDQWRFDYAKKEICHQNGSMTQLSTGEYTLLKALIDHAGITLNRDQLLDLTKGREAQLFERSIDNQISRLRRKLEADSKNPQIILTMWGGGYVFAAEVEAVD